MYAGYSKWHAEVYIDQQVGENSEENSICHFILNFISVLASSWWHIQDTYNLFQLFESA